MTPSFMRPDALDNAARVTRLLVFLSLQFVLAACGTAFYTTLPEGNVLKCDPDIVGSWRMDPNFDDERSWIVIDAGCTAREWPEDTGDFSDITNRDWDFIVAADGRRYAFLKMDEEGSGADDGDDEDARPLSKKEQAFQERLNGSFWIIPYTVDTHRIELYLTDALSTARQIEKGKIKGDYSMTADPDMEDQDASPADCIDNPRIDADECGFTATALVRGSAAQTRARLHPGSGLVHPQPIVLRRGVLPTDQKTLHKAIRQ